MSSRFPNKHFSPFNTTSLEYNLSINEAYRDDIETIFIQVGELLTPKTIPILANFMKGCKNLNSILFYANYANLSYFTVAMLLKLVQDLPITKIEFENCEIDEVDAERIAKVLPKTLKGLKMILVQWSKKFFQTIQERKIQLVELAVGIENLREENIKEKILMDFLRSFNTLQSFEVKYTYTFDFECLENHKLLKLWIPNMVYASEKGLFNLISKQNSLKVLGIGGFIKTLECMKAIGNSSIEEIIYENQRFFNYDIHIVLLFLYLKNVKSLKFYILYSQYKVTILKILAEMKSLERLTMYGLDNEFNSYELLFSMLEKNPSISYVEGSELFGKFSEEDFQRVLEFSKVKFVIKNYKNHPGYLQALINNRDLCNVEMPPPVTLDESNDGNQWKEFNRNIELWKIKSMNFKSHSEDIGFNFI